MLVTAYALERPDGQWSIMLVNKDHDNDHSVKVTFADPAKHDRFFAGPWSEWFSGRRNTCGIRIPALLRLDRRRPWQSGHADPDGPPSKSTVTAGGAETIISFRSRRSSCFAENLGINRFSIIRQRQVVDKIRAGSEIRNPGDAHEVQDLIAREERHFRFRCEQAGEAQGGFLLGPHEGPEKFLVSRERFPVITGGPVQFPGQYISRHHGQARTLGPASSETQEAASPIKCHASLRPQSRPCVHAYLAYPVEIQSRWLESKRFEYLRDIPNRYFRNASAREPFAPAGHRR